MAKCDHRQLVKSIETARAGVAKATQAHCYGRATNDDVNRANNRLAKAHERLQHHSGGIIVTGRDREELER